VYIRNSTVPDIILDHNNNAVSYPFYFKDGVDLRLKSGQIAHLKYHAGLNRIELVGVSGSGGSSSSIPSTTSVTTLKETIGKVEGDFIKTESFYDDSREGGATYQKVDPTGLTPNDIDIIEANDGSYWQLAELRVVTPYMFGALQSDSSTTDNLQTFFDYVDENDVMGDWRGVWTVSTMITIKGIEKEFYCGKIQPVGTGIPLTVRNEAQRSHFYGNFEVSGST